MLDDVDSPLQESFSYFFPLVLEPAHNRDSEKGPHRRAQDMYTNESVMFPSGQTMGFEEQTSKEQCGGSSWRQV